MPFKFNPFTSNLDVVNSDPYGDFITVGDDGIAIIRMESATKLWDVTVSDAGAWVFTEAHPGKPMGLLLTLTYT